MAAIVMKEIVEDKKAKSGMPIQLKQLKGGQPLSVKLGTKCKRKKKVQIKSETVAKIKKRLRLSERAAERFCNILREDDVRVEHGTRQFLSEIDKLLFPYYHNVQLKMEVKVIYRRVKLVR